MSGGEADSRLTELAHEVKELAASPEHERRRRLWADAVNLRTTQGIVNGYLYEDVWAAELGGEAIRSKDPFARQVETQLLFKIWRARHFNDDCPVEPTVKLPAARPQRTEAFPWGVEMAVGHTEGPGAYKEIPPLRAYEDIEKLSAPRYEIDSAQTARAVERASALTGGVLAVLVRTDELHWGPFEYAVRLRGMENLLYDVYDAKEFVHRLMEMITEGLISYQKQREAAGGVSAEASRFGHVPYDETPEGLRDKLAGTWAYIHAQSAASLSPEMYGEFVHPYNRRLAGLVGKTYYHGCEDLSKKVGIIKDLPGLRLFHISPWTPAAPVIRELGKSVAYEIHSHPTRVIFGEGREEIREELQRLAAEAKGTLHVLTLADIETFGGRFERVAYWAEAAREAARSG